MNEATDTVTEAAEEQERVCPAGERLRQAREAKGLSSEEVAAELKLQRRLIEAMEEGDIEQLPPMTFVTGYLRSYARLVELPADQLIEEFAQCSAEPPPIVSTAKEGIQASSSDLPVRLVTYLVVFGLLGLLATWWYTRQLEQPVEVKTPQVAVPAPQAEVSAAVPDESATSVQADEQNVEQTVQEAVDADTSEEAVERPVEEAEPEPVAVEQVEVERPEDDIVNGEPEATEQIPELTADMAQSELKIVLEQDSWLDVRDAAGRQLAYDLGKAGATRLLSGEAPFTVFLGYAPGVTLYYNGEVFEHGVYHRKDMARFRIGRTEDNAPRQ